MYLQNLSVFLVQKPDGGTRLILNLKELNEFHKYEHFEMGGIKTVINMITRNCFMAAIDLKDAYYSVSVSRPFHKFLKFKWTNKLHCFICFRNGLWFFLTKFTKKKRKHKHNNAFVRIYLLIYIMLKRFPSCSDTKN